MLEHLHCGVWPYRNPSLFILQCPNIRKQYHQLLVARHSLHIEASYQIIAAMTVTIAAMPIKFFIIQLCLSSLTVSVASLKRHPRSCHFCTFHEKSLTDGWHWICLAQARVAVKSKVWYDILGMILSLSFSSQGLSGGTITNPSIFTLPSAMLLRYGVRRDSISMPLDQLSC